MPFDLNHYTPSQHLLENKTILISGAGDGIGKALSLTAAKYGATVILLGRTVEKLEKVYDDIEQAGYPQAAIIPLDLETATEENYQSLKDSIEQNLGKLDGLIHNAALLGDRTSISNYKANVWHRLMSVNVTAPFLLTKAMLPLLIMSEAASIIFTGSTVGYRGRAYWGAYAASKAANENLMQTLADELGETTHIKTNSINPGATRTNMRSTAFPAEDPDTIKSAEDLMPLYLYLLGADSKGINGQQLDFNQLTAD